jgi:hypothetical protein
MSNGYSVYWGADNTAKVAASADLDQVAAQGRHIVDVVPDYNDDLGLQIGVGHPDRRGTPRVRRQRRIRLRRTATALAGAHRLRPGRTGHHLRTSADETHASQRPTGRTPLPPHRGPPADLQLDLEE